MNQMGDKGVLKCCWSSFVGRTVGLILAVFLVVFHVAGPIAGEESEAGGVVAADSVRKYRFLGKTARDKKEFDAALGYYGKVLRYKPADLKAHFFSALILIGKGHIPLAKKHLFACIEFDSLHVNSNVLLTQLYIRAEQPDSAWIFLDPVLSAKPGVAKYHQFRRQIADAYRIIGDKSAAITHYTALVEHGDADGKLYDLLSELHQASGDMETALGWSSRALSSPGGSKSNTVGRLNRMLNLQVASGERSAAYHTIKQLTKSDSINRYHYFSRLENLAREAGDRARQREGLEGMVVSQPQDLELLSTLVEFHLREADLDAASTWLTRGINVDSQNGHLRLLEGELLVLRGDEEAAIVAFEKARQDPNWEAVAQQRIWKLRPPETEEEKLKRAFFGSSTAPD